ncbi:hypothetical protein [Lutibacter citreus]|uniref:hypothetical protein n=1 Tax=Lutibacter citreus TaxID=2138210 RepID=UPI000DBE9AFE|nr:hypothetical protein [Lutibacter citreus]
MKNLIRKSLLIAMLVTCSIAMAKGNDPSITVDVVKSKLVHLTMKGNLNSVELSVKDSYGIILHTETVQNLNISRKFDLASLPKGEYSLVVESLTNIKTIPFKVSQNTVNFNKDHEEVYNKPVVVLNNNMVLISQLALENESLEISVFNKYEDQVYAEVLKSKEKTLKRMLNFKNLESGTYKIVLRNGEKTFYKTISI